MAKLFGIAVAGAVGLMATNTRAGRGLRRGFHNWSTARVRNFRERTRRLRIKDEGDEDLLVRAPHPAELYADAPREAHGAPDAPGRGAVREQLSGEPLEYQGSAKWDGDPLVEAISER